MLQLEAVRNLHLAEGARDGLVHSGNLTRTLGQLRDFPRLELEAVQQRGLGVIFLGGGDVQLILRNDGGFVSL